MENLSEWSKRAYQILDSRFSSISNMGIVFPPSPDGIASSVILSEIASQKGIYADMAVAVPENFMEVVEYYAGRCDSLVFIDIPPHGSGLIQAAGELFREVIIIDHGSTYVYNQGNIARLGIDKAGISTSLLVYLLAVEFNEENDMLSWIAASGFYGKCHSKPCLETYERAKLSWPELSEDLSLREIQEVLVAASFLGEDWIYLAASALQESFDDPSWFLSGNSATASLLRSKVNDVKEEIRNVLDEPFLMRDSFGAWESPEPYQRIVLALISKKEIVKCALSFFYDPPLGLIYIATREDMDLGHVVRRELEGLEFSLFGGKDFASIIIDSDYLERTIRSLSKVLSR